MTKPFRFSVLTTQGSEMSTKDWTGYARQIEDLGFSLLQVADHADNQTVCTPRLAAAAAVTTTLRLGSYVYNNDFRHPVQLAREAAELDVLSDGRMELGIGAGWAKEEYLRLGISFDAGSVRAARFREAVGIVQQLHAGQCVTVAGDHYRLTECELHVNPVQQPIPLVLGGGGPQMIRFAAEHADTVAFVPPALPGGGINPAQFSAAAFDEKIAILDAARGDRDPERAILAFEVHRSADALPRDGWTAPEMMLDGPYALVGGTAELVDVLLARRERWGLSHWTCWEHDIDMFVPLIDALAGR